MSENLSDQEIGGGSAETPAEGDDSDGTDGDADGTDGTDTDGTDGDADAADPS